MSSSPDDQTPSTVGPQNPIEPLNRSTTATVTSIAMTVLTFLYLLVTVAICYIAYLSYEGSNRQQEFFERQVVLVGESAKTFKQVQLGFDLYDFHEALNKAEPLYRACPTCEPDYMLSVHLDTAKRLEKTLEDHISAAEYVRLASLGSAVWSFETLEAICEKALRKAQTPLDRHFAMLMLAHAHFTHYGHNDRARLETARRYFSEALALLETAPPTMNSQYFLGAASELWAAHEMFQKNEGDAQQKKTRAMSYWSKLPNHESLGMRLDRLVARAKNGFAPNAPCYFVFPVTTIAPALPPKTLPPDPAPAPSLPVAPSGPKPAI